MKENVLAFMEKHQLLKKNSTVLVGVSGGPDSMALLHLLHSMQKDWNLTLYALSVDHQLRAEDGKRDCEYVKSICAKWGIDFIGTSINVPLHKKENRLGTQEAARHLRYAFYEEQINELNADYLALGHHGDDQVETMLMRLSRTAESSAFSGMPIKRKLGMGLLIRPLLCVTKTTIESYCKSNGITPRIDPTNFETDYTRNYYRKNLLPILKEKNRNIHITVQHLSETLKEDEDYLQNEAKKMLHSIVQFNSETKTVQFEIKPFKSRALALQRRGYHLILKYLYEKMPKDLSYVHEEQFLALLSSDKANTQIDFPHHLKVEKSYHIIKCYFKIQPSPEFSFHKKLEIPGEITLPDGSTIIATYTNQMVQQDKYTFVCDKDDGTLPFYVRTRKNGDRMSWVGLNGRKKLKDIFIDEKIPLSERDTWPIITDNNGKILWLIGLKKGQTIINEEDNSFICLQYKKANK